MSRTLLAPAGDHESVAAAFDRAALAERGRPWVRLAWSAWSRLEDPRVWQWFAGAMGLPEAWTFAGVREPWAAAGLLPGVARVTVTAQGFADLDALADAGGDPIAARQTGQPAICFPQMPRRIFWDWADPGAAEPLEIYYLRADGSIATPYGPAAVWLGRDPAPALETGAAWRLYGRPLDWLRDALQFRDGFDAADPWHEPGGGVALDPLAFAAVYGEALRLAATPGVAATKAAAAYERARRGVLRPKRAALPAIEAAA